MSSEDEKDLNDSIVQLKEEALREAKKLYVDYTLFIDPDAYLLNSNTLRNLVETNFTISGPLLNSIPLYSNFWGEMSESFWYLRSSNYIDITERNIKGCFEAKLLKSFVLINMWTPSSDSLTFDVEKLGVLTVPEIESIVFAVSASKIGIQQQVCNNEIYGYMEYNMNTDDTSEDRANNHIHLKLMMLRERFTLTASKFLTQYVQKKPEVRSREGFDKIFYINLERRKEKRKYMEKVLAELQLEAVRKVGVDGKKLNMRKLKKQGIQVLKDYYDPQTRYPMHPGDIGCFLSHFKIWKEIVDKSYEKVMILEDDVFIKNNFKRVLNSTMKQIEDAKLDWDLIYLGRKTIFDEEEEKVPGVDGLYIADYSHWLVGYLLSFSGAVKLVNGKPLNKLITVDEYVPMMANTNLDLDYLEDEFPIRTLKTFAIEPSIAEPRYSTNQLFFISDSEDIDRTTPVSQIEIASGIKTS